MSLTKVAYSLSAIAKQIKSAKRAGKIFNGRGLEIGMGDKPGSLFAYSLNPTKKPSSPVTIAVEYHKGPNLAKKFLMETRLRKGVYDNGGSVKALTGFVNNHKVHGVDSPDYSGMAEKYNPHRIGTLPLKDRHLGFHKPELLDGDNKKALNLIVHKHEQDELRAAKELKLHTKDTHKGMPRSSNWVGTSHIAPSVVLRESNALRTLGAGTGGKEIYHKAKGLMHYSRTEAGGEQKLINEIIGSRPAKTENLVFPAKNKLPATQPSTRPYFEYGKTRLSRHAIKRLDQAAIRKGDTTIISDKE